MLRKSPAFGVIAVLTLALGIGANTAIFSLIDAALMRALPVSDPQSLLVFRWSALKSPTHLSMSSYGDCSRDPGFGEENGCSLSEPFFHEIQSQTNVFSDLMAFSGGGGLDMTGNGPATTLDNVEYISGTYFQTLGVRPESGRLIGSADDSVSATPVAVIGYGFWKDHFGASPDAVGKTVFLNRVPVTIVGVAERRFDALSPGIVPQIWIPHSVQRQIEVPWDHRESDPHNWWLVIVGRLKPRIAVAQAQAAVSTIFANDATGGDQPQLKTEDKPAMHLVPAQQALTGETAQMATPMYVLMLAVGVVLLISCANVAGLLLSRAAARQKEIAVRFALGARRGRIVRQLLTESLLLSVAGGAVGLLFAKWLTVAIGAFFTANTDGPPPFNPAIDARVLLFTAAVSILSGILFGLAPALRGSANLTPALKTANGTMPAARRISRWFSIRNALVVAQVALTVIVLAGAGLLVRTLQSLRSVDPGFDTRSLLTFRVDPTSAGYKRAQVDGFLHELNDRLASIPGVTSASYAWRSLLGGSLWTTGFHLPGEPKDQSRSADMLPIGIDFLRTMRIPLVLGRELMPEDFATAARNAEVRETQNQRVQADGKSAARNVAELNNADVSGLPPEPVIVNDALVKKYFPAQNPLGIRFGAHVADQEDPRASPGWVIVGVAGNARYNSLRREVEPTIYAPFTGQGASFALRTSTDPASIVPQIRSIIGKMDASLPVNGIRTQSQQIDRQLFAERLIARLSSFFGLLAVLLSCIGLYGLLAYEVTRRTREIGIRMALGARAGNVLRLVIGQGIALAGMGAAVGVVAALGVTRFLGELLYGVKPSDPLTFVAVAFFLAVVALLACYIPARRATRVDPMIALRYE